MNEKPVIVMSMCTWDSIKSQSAFEMCQLICSGILSATNSTSGTLLPNARNDSVKDIYKNNPDFTHILFLDSDMAGVTPQLLVKLVMADKDIVAPIFTSRYPPYRPANRIKDEVLLEEFKKIPAERQLLETDGVGMACTLVKREVLDKTVQIYNGESRWFTMATGIRPSFQSECDEELIRLNEEGVDEKEDMYAAYFKAGIAMGLGAYKHGKVMGEDYSFCAEARRHGFKCWVDPNLHISHIGDVQYNTRDWLDYINATNSGQYEIVDRIANGAHATWKFTKKEPRIKI